MQSSKMEDDFPWMKIVTERFSKTFPNDYEVEALHFLHECIEKEVQVVLESQNKKRAQTLYATLTYFYNHFCWKIRWQMDSSSMKLCCVKLLSNFIRTALFLACGSSASMWIDRILAAIRIFPGDYDSVYTALLLIINLKKKYHHAYAEVLKHVLYKESRDSIEEPIEYMKVILLIRRLKMLLKYKSEKSDIVSLAARIRPPSNIVTWLSSLNGKNLSKLKYRLFAKQLISKKFPDLLYKKVRKMILGYKYEYDQENPFIMDKEGQTSMSCDEASSRKKKSTVSNTNYQKSAELHPHSSNKSSGSSNIKRNPNLTQKGSKLKEKPIQQVSKKKLKKDKSNLGSCHSQSLQACDKGTDKFKFNFGETNAIPTKKRKKIVVAEVATEICESNPILLKKKKKQKLKAKLRNEELSAELSELQPVDQLDLSGVVETEIKNNYLNEKLESASSAKIKGKESKKRKKLKLDLQPNELYASTLKEKNEDRENIENASGLKNVTNKVKSQKKLKRKLSKLNDSQETASSLVTSPELFIIDKQPSEVLDSKKRKKPKLSIQQDEFHTSTLDAKCKKSKNVKSKEKLTKKSKNKIHEPPDVKSVEVNKNESQETVHSLTTSPEIFIIDKKPSEAVVSKKKKKLKLSIPQNELHSSKMDAEYEKIKNVSGLEKAKNKAKLPTKLKIKTNNLLESQVYTNRIEVEENELQETENSPVSSPKPFVIDKKPSEVLDTVFIVKDRNSKKKAKQKRKLSKKPKASTTPPQAPYYSPDEHAVESNLCVSETKLNFTKSSSKFSEEVVTHDKCSNHNLESYACLSNILISSNDEVYQKMFIEENTKHNILGKDNKGLLLTSNSSIKLNSKRQNERGIPTTCIGIVESIPRDIPNHNILQDLKTNNSNFVRETGYKSEEIREKMCQDKQNDSVNIIIDKETPSSEISNVNEPDIPCSSSECFKSVLNELHSDLSDNSVISPSTDLEHSGSKPKIKDLNSEINSAEKDVINFEQPERIQDNSNRDKIQKYLAYCHSKSTVSELNQDCTSDSSVELNLHSADSVTLTKLTDDKIPDRKCMRELFSNSKSSLNKDYFSSKSENESNNSLTNSYVAEAIANDSDEDDKFFSSEMKQEPKIESVNINLEQNKLSLLKVSTVNDSEVSCSDSENHNFSESSIIIYSSDCNKMIEDKIPADSLNFEPNKQGVYSVDLISVPSGSQTRNVSSESMLCNKNENFVVENCLKKEDSSQSPNFSSENKSLLVDNNVNLDLSLKNYKIEDNCPLSQVNESLMKTSSDESRVREISINAMCNEEFMEDKIEGNVDSLSEQYNKSNNYESADDNADENADAAESYLNEPTITEANDRIISSFNDSCNKLVSQREENENDFSSGKGQMIARNFYSVCKKEFITNKTDCNADSFPKQKHDKIDILVSSNDEKNLESNNYEVINNNLNIDCIKSENHEIENTSISSQVAENSIETNAVESYNDKAMITYAKFNIDKSHNENCYETVSPNEENVNTEVLSENAQVIREKFDSICKEEFTVNEIEDKDDAVPKLQHDKSNISVSSNDKFKNLESNSHGGLDDSLSTIKSKNCKIESNFSSHVTENSIETSPVKSCVDEAIVTDNEDITENSWNDDFNKLLSSSKKNESFFPSEKSKVREANFHSVYNEEFTEDKTDSKVDSLPKHHYTSNISFLNDNENKTFMSNSYGGKDESLGIKTIKTENWEVEQHCVSSQVAENSIETNAAKTYSGEAVITDDKESINNSIHDNNKLDSSCKDNETIFTCEKPQTAENIEIILKEESVVNQTDVPVASFPEHQHDKLNIPVSNSDENKKLESNSCKMSNNNLNISFVKTENCEIEHNDLNISSIDYDLNVSSIKSENCEIEHYSLSSSIAEKSVKANAAETYSDEAMITDDKDSINNSISNDYNRLVSSCKDNETIFSSEKPQSAENIKIMLKEEFVTNQTDVPVDSFPKQQLDKLNILVSNNNENKNFESNGCRMNDNNLNISSVEPENCEIEHNFLSSSIAENSLETNAAKAYSSKAMITDDKDSINDSISDSSNKLVSSCKDNETTSEKPQRAQNFESILKEEYVANQTDGTVDSFLKQQHDKINISVSNDDENFESNNHRFISNNLNISSVKSENCKFEHNSVSSKVVEINVEANTDESYVDKTIIKDAKCSTANSTNENYNQLVSLSEEKDSSIPFKKAKILEANSDIICKGKLIDNKTGVSDNAVLKLQQYKSEVSVSNNDENIKFESNNCEGIDEDLNKSSVMLGNSEVKVKCSSSEVTENSVETSSTKLSYDKDMIVNVKQSIDDSPSDICDKEVSLNEENFFPSEEGQVRVNFDIIHNKNYLESDNILANNEAESLLSSSSEEVSGSATDMTVEEVNSLNSSNTPSPCNTPSVRRSMRLATKKRVDDTNKVDDSSVVNDLKISVKNTDLESNFGNSNDIFTKFSDEQDNVIANQNSDANVIEIQKDGLSSLSNKNLRVVLEAVSLEKLTNYSPCYKEPSNLATENATPLHENKHNVNDTAALDSMCFPSLGKSESFLSFYDISVNNSTENGSESMQLPDSCCKTKNDIFSSYRDKSPKSASNSTNSCFLDNKTSSNKFKSRKSLESTPNMQSTLRKDLSDENISFKSETHENISRKKRSTTDFIMKLRNFHKTCVKTGTDPSAIQKSSEMIQNSSEIALKKFNKYENKFTDCQNPLVDMGVKCDSEAQEANAFHCKSKPSEHLNTGVIYKEDSKTEEESDSLRNSTFEDINTSSSFCDTIKHKSKCIREKDAFYEKLNIKSVSKKLEYEQWGISEVEIASDLSVKDENVAVPSQKESKVSVHLDSISSESGLSSNDNSEDLVNNNLSMSGQKRYGLRSSSKISGKDTNFGLDFSQLCINSPGSTKRLGNSNTTKKNLFEGAVSRISLYNKNSNQNNNDAIHSQEPSHPTATDPNLQLETASSTVIKSEESRTLDNDVANSEKSSYRSYNLRSRKSLIAPAVLNL